MSTRPHHPANGRVSPSQAAAAAGGDLIIGRDRIAAEVGRSPRTISRWFRAGILLAAKIGPAPNNIMIARAADLEQLVEADS